MITRLFILMIAVCSVVSTNGAITQLNALSWAKADGTDQTVNMQRAVNAAKSSGQSLYIPPGIVFNINALTNTSGVLMEEYSSPGIKDIRGAVRVSGPAGGTNSFPNHFVGEGGLTVQDVSVDIRTTGARISQSDNASDIQEAIDAVPDGGVVLIPRGTFLYSNVAVTDKTVILRGEQGAVLIQTASADGAAITVKGSGRLYAEGVTFDGNKANRSSKWDSIVNAGSFICSTSATAKVYLRNVTLTNTVRSAIRVANHLDMEASTVIHPNEHNGTSITHCIFAQPVGPGSDLEIRVVNCDFIATSTEEADLFKQAAGIFVTLAEDGVSKFKRLIVHGNRFKGIGCTRAANPSSPLDTYNGTDFGSVIGNHVWRTAYSAFKIQRSGWWTVMGNTIEDVSNTDDNQCFGIDWSPTAREGVPPFVGPLAGQHHSGFVCIGNVITNCHRTSIYVDGPNALIQGNHIGANLDADDGSNLPLVTVGDNVAILNNFFYGMTKNGIWAVGVTNNQFRDNVFVPGDQSATDTLIQLNDVYHSDVTGNFLVPTSDPSTQVGIGVNVLNSSFIVSQGNRVYNALTSFQYSNVTNSWHRENQSFNAGWNDIASTNYVDLRQENSNYRPWQWRYDTNGLAYLSVQNQHTNTLAQALIEVLTLDSGGYIAAYPSNSANTRLAGRMVLGANTTASGINVELTYGQQFNLGVGTNVWINSLSNYTTITGLNPTSLQLNTGNASGNYVLFRHLGTPQGWFGYSAGNPGMAILNAAGSAFNFHVADDGVITMTDKARVDNNAAAGETRLLLWDVTAGSLKRVTVDGSRFLKLAP